MSNKDLATAGCNTTAQRAYCDGHIEDCRELPGGIGDGAIHASIAMSLKRIADMMEEDRKPRLALALPDGIEEVDAKHRRLLLEGLAEERSVLERIASALEARHA